MVSEAPPAGGAPGPGCMRAGGRARRGAPSTSLARPGPEAAPAASDHHGLDLQTARLSGAYRGRLEYALRLFEAWCSEPRMSIESLVNTPPLVNETLISFIQYLFDVNAAHWVAVHSVFGCPNEMKAS